MFVHECGGCEFESRCSHLNFRYRACFEKEVPWHSRNYTVWIHSKTRTWHDKIIQSNTPCVQVLKIYSQVLNHLASLAKWVRVRLRTKWLWVLVSLQSFKMSLWEKHWLKIMPPWCYPVPRAQEAREFCENWQYFDISLISLSMGRDKSAHNLWFLIAQTQKVGILQVAAFDKDIFYLNGKPSISPSTIPSTYYHYFHALQIPSENLIHLRKLVF